MDTPTRYGRVEAITWTLRNSSHFQFVSCLWGKDITYCTLLRQNNTEPGL